MGLWVSEYLGQENNYLELKYEIASFSQCGIKEEFSSLSVASIMITFCFHWVSPNIFKLLDNVYH